MIAASTRWAYRPPGGPKDRPSWDHLCPETGRIVLTAHQMGVYGEYWANGHRYPVSEMEGETVGCPFCLDLPEELLW